MPSNKVKRPAFTLETAVKKFVYSQSVLTAFADASEKGESFTWPLKPIDVGSLKNPLAFPRIFEVGLAGQPIPASLETWDAFFIQRLRTGGAEPFSSGIVLKPCSEYNKTLITFHLGQLDTTRARADFQGYMRRVLLNSITKVRSTDSAETVQVLYETLTWLESYSKQLSTQYLAEAKKKEKEDTSRSGKKS
ncbi:hypothetical protein [Hymenobacter persicinus]|uniref:Uncharacterized protein n=1 Tax=Hymenobacter persicinus TaxID=2025506 RepID=A0A4Q5LFS3_9BACT|nr:hypothetical protein [Hymenobacter persicinus]RYU83813.1 hypothetical protein EWM57_02405 [Hymenobacter persicinus]